MTISCFLRPVRAISARCLSILLSAFFILIVSIQGGTAHEIRPAIADLTFPEPGKVQLDMSLILEAAIARIGSGHGDTDESANAKAYDALRQLEPDALSAAFTAFEADFIEGTVIVADGERVALTVKSLEPEPVGDLDFARLATLSLEGNLPEGSTTVTFSFNPEFGPAVLRVPDPETGDYVYSVYLENGTTSDAIAVNAPPPERSAGAIFLDYVVIGFTHIVPKGLDHILFVVGLYLLSARWKPLLIQVTAFTLAHSVTLALGMLGLVSVPASIVEPLIALSIVFIAVENLFTDRMSRHRAVIVFCFGLLHGLGFAGVLTEIGLSPAHFVSGLIAFNIGVEAGQLAVIAACFLAFGYWFSSRSWYRSGIVRPLSVGIALVALFWFAERTGLIA